MGVGGQVRGTGEEEVEVEEQQRERAGMERAEEVKSRVRSEKFGRWRRRCERIFCWCFCLGRFSCGKG